MKKRFYNPAVLPLLAMMIATAPAWANISVSLNQYINNPGFELLSSPLANCGTANGTVPLNCNGSVADWSVVSGPGSGGGAGTVQLSGQSVAVYGQTQLMSLQGNNAAYINNTTTYDSSAAYATGWVAISQTLNSVNLQPGTTYTFTYDVARRADDVGGNFRVQVNAIGSSNAAVAGQDYWILAGDTTSFTPGQWVSETLTFTTPSDASLFGATPTVYLVNDGSDAPFTGSNASVAQVEFDTPEPVEFVPLAIMFGLLGVARRSRLRTA